jgi:hypothetical protein
MVKLFHAALEDPNLNRRERKEIVDIQHCAAQIARQKAGTNPLSEANYEELLNAQLERYIGHVEYIRGRAANRNSRPAERF